MSDLQLAPGAAPGVIAPGRRTAGEVRRGALAMAPLIVGYAPFALVVGSAAGQHTSPLAAWAGIWVIFGGSAHLATLRALDGGSAVLAVVTGLVVNARLLVYSASLSGVWRGQPRWFRAAAAALVIDPTWLAAERRAGEPGTPQDHRRFFVGAGLTLGAAWCALVTTGMLVGDRAAAWFDLEVAVPLCLVALVGPRLLERDGRPVVLVAALAAWLTAGLPSGSGLLVAVAAGVAAAVVCGRSSS